MASDPAQFLCGECGKGFVDKVKLGLHHYSVHAEKPFECTHCGEKGNGVRKFLNHIREHSTQKKVDKCAECQFETQKPGNLKRHMQILQTVELISVEFPPLYIHSGQEDMDVIEYGICVDPTGKIFP